MEIWSIDRDASISLTEWEIDDYGVKVAMAAQNGTFAGANEEVWFFRDRFAAFTQALGAFALERDGEVHIESMSPGEGVLTIRRLDLARHILVRRSSSRVQFLQRLGRETGGTRDGAACTVVDR
jgi:hypothetical protein